MSLEDNNGTLGLCWRVSQVGTNTIKA
jgi:hypothetical protein